MPWAATAPTLKCLYNIGLLEFHLCKVLVQGLGLVAIFAITKSLQGLGRNFLGF